MKIRYLYKIGEPRDHTFKYLWALADAFVGSVRFSQDELTRRCTGLDSNYDRCTLPWRYDAPECLALEIVFQTARDSADLNAARVWWYFVARELLQMAVEDAYPGSHLDIVITERDGHYELTFKSTEDLMKFSLEAQQQ